MDRVVEYALTRFALASLNYTPLPLARRLANSYTRLLDLAIPRLRRVARRNLQIALPGADHEEIINGVFRSIGRMLLTFAKFERIDKHNVSDWIRYEGFEYFEQALGRGKGVLFATAHLGNWELSAFAHALMSAPMHVVVRPLDNLRVNALVEARRSSSGNRIIGKREFARAILRALRANEAVGVLIDQNVAADEGVFVDFFGIPACTESGFVKLAARSGATVIPGFALWSEQEQRYLLRFYPPVPMTENPVVDTQALHQQLESVIREYPDQWLWIHRRWKTRPNGEAPLY